MPTWAQWELLPPTDLHEASQQASLTSERPKEPERTGFLSRAPPLARTEVASRGQARMPRREPDEFSETHGGPGTVNPGLKTDVAGNRREVNAHSPGKALLDFAAS